MLTHPIDAYMSLAPGGYELMLYFVSVWLPCEFQVDPQSSGPRLNIKTVLSTYGDFHVKDKTAVRTSYL